MTTLIIIVGYGTAALLSRGAAVTAARAIAARARTLSS